MVDRAVNILSFGAAGPNGYIFSNVSRATTNFSKVESRVTGVTGFDGGIDEYRTGTAPRSKGTVTVELWLLADDPSDMTDQRDAINALPFWGVRELFLAPYNELEPNRWCYARCIDIKMPEDASRGSENQLQVTLTFEVSSPFWYSLANLEWVGTPTLLIGDAWTVRGARQTVTITDGLEVTVVNRGNAPTPLTLELSNLGGGWLVGDPGIVIGDPLLFIGGYGPSSEITVTALNSRGVALDRWTWSGTLGQHERLVVNTDALSVTHRTQLADETGWDDFAVVTGTGFIRLAPGTTRIRFDGAFQGGQVRLFYTDAWSS